jgi:hypothetical protein
VTVADESIGCFLVQSRKNQRTEPECRCVSLSART